jgi:hypothetical protein
MKTKKTKRLNFNTYIKAQTHPFGAEWVVRRGRLSRASVETRALIMGYAPGVGSAAWAGFIEARDALVVPERPVDAPDTLQTSLPYNP